MEGSIRDLIENLKQQKGIYLNMLHLARQQLKAVQDPVGSGIDEDLVLQQKAKLVEDMQLVAVRARLIENDLAERLGLAEFTINGIKGKIDDEMCQSLVLAFEDLSSVLKDIADLDAETVRLISSRLTVYQRPRQRPTDTLQALQAYRDGSLVKKD